MEIIKDIAAIIGLIMSVIALITACSKHVQNFWQKIFRINTKELREENEHQNAIIEDIQSKMDMVLKKMNSVEQVSRQQCRDTIKEIYYKYVKEKKIPLYERKTADRTWEVYQTFPNANSYAALLYKEITKWEIDSDTITHIDED